MSNSTAGLNCGSFSLLALVLLLGFASCVASCTRAELESKAEAYDTAIAESNNAQILLNAVRASQRAPMSFVGLGDLTAQPAVTAGAGGAFNFIPSGLLGYNLNPSVSVSGGFTSYQLSNLNRTGFMERMQTPIPQKLVDNFFQLHWPDELIHLMVIRQIDPRPDEYAQLVQYTVETCRSVPEGASGHYAELCQRLAEDQRDFKAEGCYESFDLQFLNTAREFCSMKQFQIVLRMFRLRRYEARKLQIRSPARSPQEILYYLGELVAAQNYSTQPYCPTVFVGQAGGGRRHEVPLFVVRRAGAVPGPSAVSISYNGEVFYIPKPELGSVDEARSLQVLDFVNQVITTVTQDADLPKSNTGTLVLAH